MLMISPFGFTRKLRSAWLLASNGMKSKLTTKERQSARPNVQEMGWILQPIEPAGPVYVVFVSPGVEKYESTQTVLKRCLPLSWAE